MKPSSPNIYLQSRDFEILRGLFECRVMTLAQIASIYFEDRPESAKKRLQKLNREGLIRTREQNGIFVRQLTATALKLLQNQGILSEYPRFSPRQLERRLRVSDHTLNHELDCIDVKAAFTTAIIATTDLELIRFSTWPLLHQFSGSANYIVKPDGFLHVRQQMSEDQFRDLRYFVEIDRSTESQKVLLSKLAEYGMHYRRCRREIRDARESAGGTNHLFRLLIVCKTAERRDSVRKHLLETTPHFTTKVFLSSLGEVRNAPLESIGLC